MARDVCLVLVLVLLGAAVATVRADVPVAKLYNAAEPGMTMPFIGLGTGGNVPARIRKNNKQQTTTVVKAVNKQSTVPL